MNNAMWFWLLAIVVFSIAEAATAALVSVWFVAGSAAALLAAGLNASILVQVIVFVGVSALTLALTRPLVSKLKSKKAVATNVDRLIGQPAKVTEVIDNINETGTVFIDGLPWTARSVTDAVIAKGALVKIKSIEGVKVIVEPIEGEKTNA
jgi:membrane protein implicated in regulation of membrane protease activity